MSSFGSFKPQPEPISKKIDFASMVNALDPTWKSPPVVYLYSNGRKFKEYPQADQVVNCYCSEDGGTLYYQSDSPTFVFYSPE